MSSFRQLMMKKKGGGSQIEYLQSDGAIYIPLCEGAETLSVKSFKIDIEFIATSSEQVFLGRYHNRYGSVTYNYGLVSTYIPDFTIGVYSGGYSMTSTVQTPYTERKLLNFSFSSQVSFDNNYGLFGGYWLSNGYDGLKYSICKIWSCILYDKDGNEVANLLPKEENGVLGMYDSVRNKFIAGVGSGSFIAG